MFSPISQYKSQQTKSFSSMLHAVACAVQSLSAGTTWPLYAIWQEMNLQTNNTVAMQEYGGNKNQVEASYTLCAVGCPQMFKLVN